MYSKDNKIFIVSILFLIICEFDFVSSAGGSRRHHRVQVTFVL